MDEVESIDHAIAGLETQREVLGDDVVDTALQPLKEKRAALVARLAGEQRKLVTVLFSDLVDFTVLSQSLDPEDVRSIVNAYFSRWQERIDGNGGVVEKFIGDAVMAVFGLTQAHEDDPHRAIRAALGMARDLDALNADLEAEYGVRLAMRIGIDTGEVVVSTLGERAGHEFVVVGDTVNRASRLQAVAPPDSVLISSDTYRHVRGAFGFQPRAGLVLKGIAQPVDGYLVLAERPRGFRLDETRGIEGVQTQMIGRDLELRSLQDRFWDIVEDPHFRVVTVMGEAGVGKSRLLLELDRWLAESPQGVWWFRGRAANGSDHLPNSVLRDLAATRFEIQESEDPARVRERWEQGIAQALGESEESRRKAHTIAHWLGFEIGESALLAGLLHDPQGLRDRAMAAFAEYFERLAKEAPVVALLEDLHWADDSSLAALDAANAVLHSSPVLVVATARPSLLERHPHWGEGLDFHSRLDLRTLSLRESRRLLTDILQRVDEVPEVLTDLVVGAAEGNPYYIEELVKFFLEAGVITKDGGDGDHSGRWKVHPERIEGVRVPPTLKGVLQARVDALTAGERLVLQRASVIGRVFWDDAVASLAMTREPPGAGDATSDALDHLRSREVVYERERSSFDATREFLFKHVLLRDVAYDSVLRARRQEYHGLAARWLEQMTERTRRADEYAGLIAAHYDRANDPAAATRWYLRAGRQAAAVHALADASRLLGRGIDIAPAEEAGALVDLLLARETVLQRVGDRDAQLADLGAIERLLGDADDVERRICWLLARSRWLFHGSDYAEGTEVAREAAALAATNGLRDMEVEARLWMGKNLAWESQHHEANAVLEEALTAARAVGQPRLIGETLRYLGIVANNVSEFDRAVALLEESRRVHVADGDPEGESLALVQLASVLYNQGQYRAARAYIEESLPIFVASGYRYRQAVAMSNLASLAVFDGELGLARRLVTDGYALCVELGEREGAATAVSLLGDIARRAGDYEEAAKLLRESMAIITELDWSFLGSDVQLTLALVAAEQGDAEEAIVAAQSAVDLARKAESKLALARALFGHGRALLVAGRPAEAEGSLREARSTASELGLRNAILESEAALACALLPSDRAAAVGLATGVLDRVDTEALAGALQPGEVFLACAQVLAAVGDPRAAEARKAGRNYLDTTAERIDDDDLRDGYLHRVPAHVELRTALSP